MDKYSYEEYVLPFLGGGEGWDEEYSSVNEFKQHLSQDALVVEKLRYGCVFWRQMQQQQLQLDQPHIIKNLLEHIAYKIWDEEYYLIQIWATVRVEGGHHYLSTSNQPFYVSRLKKGLCWYRKICMDYVYDVDVELGEEAKGFGGVGRAYRNNKPESTPDLRLYSTYDFPLRDYAARCGFRSYLALPLCDIHNQNQCKVVMEFLSTSTAVVMKHPNFEFYRSLENAGLRPTHSYNSNKELINISLQIGSDIQGTFELAFKVVPQLSLAQVWVPCNCKQCNDASCMECVYSQHDQFDILNDIEMFKYGKELIEYVDACKFHYLQIGVNSMDRDLSKNPLAHYAQRARFSLGFAISLQSGNNHSNVIQFFLQPQHRQHSSVQMLLRIILMKFKSFKFVWGQKLLEEFTVPNIIELDSIHMLNSMDSYGEFSELDFTKYLETVDLCCFRPFKYINEDSEDSNEDDEDAEDSLGGWVFSSPNEEVCDARLAIKEKIQYFMMELATTFHEVYYMVQFWAPIMDGEKQYLKTRDEPYVLGCLAKGLASFRKECIKSHYFVDEEAKEDEIGPIGRVFRDGHPELVYDLVSYSTNEFYMTSYAMHCGIDKYFALPVFDELNEHNCVGVLEFLGLEEYHLLYTWPSYNFIREALKVAKLSSTHFCSHPTPMEVHDCNIEAMGEIKIALDLISKIPQCQTANVWVPYEKCVSSNSRRMKWFNPLEEKDSPQSDLIRVEPKIGIIGAILESESKSCFCQNMGEFSIAEQPLEYFGRKLRSKTCFAICLQSSQTGDLLYVLEFLLYQTPATYHYVISFLNFLLPVLKFELKSFKTASGKQLGDEELVVEVIEFSEANQFTFSESEGLYKFPIKFKRVMYVQKEHRHIKKQQVQSNPEARQRKQHNVVATNFKKTDKGKGKSGLKLSLEVLKPHFGKKLKYVKEELGVGRSTIKRACRDIGLSWWPCNKKQAMNLPSLFGTETTQNHEGQSSSSSLQVLDTSKAEKGSFIIVDDSNIELNIDGFNTSRGETTALTTSFKNTMFASRMVPVKHKENANAPLPIPLSNVGVDAENQPNTSEEVPHKGPPENNGQKVRCYALLPEALKMLCICFKHLSDGRGIQIVLDNDVFCCKCEIYIHLEDLTPFCNLEPISGSCIVVYIWHLYNKMKDKNILKRFQFVNPFAISYVPNSQSDRQADALVDGFNSTSPNQILLAPCNVGAHWILTIIQPYKEIVYLLDPLAHYNYESWKNVVNVAISKFNDNLGKNGKEQPTWVFIKV